MKNPLSRRIQGYRNIDQIMSGPIAQKNVATECMLLLWQYPNLI